MNIEDLSKSQLILLTILVNFVTSVATGIITVSLLDQAPPFVTQTVNQVVERTIETVAQAAPAAIVTAPTPAPSNQDLVTAAIAADAARVVAIYDVKTGTSSPAAAVGTFLPGAHAVATAALDSLPKEALIGFSDGSYVPASISRSGNGVVIYGFADGATLPKVSAAALISSDKLKLGQTALAVGTDGSASTGIVSHVTKSDIQTTLPDIGTGSAAVDISGNLIGIAKGGTVGAFIPASVISSLLAATSSATTTASHA